MRKLPVELSLETLEGRLLPSTAALVNEVEPNNTIRVAQNLPAADEVRVAGRISTLTDVDYFHFQALLGQPISLNCHDPSGNPDRRQQLDPMIGLFDPTGRLVALDDDGGTGSYWASALNYTATMNGVWTVAVTDYNDSNFDGIGGDYDGFGQDIGNYLLQVRVGQVHPDLVARTLTWDTTRGGLSFSYSVDSAPLPAGSTPLVELFWARGNRLEDRMGDAIAIPGFQVDPREGTHTVNVPGSALLNAPLGDTQLLLVLDRRQAITESNENNNVLALRDVVVNRDASASGVVSEYSLNVLRELLRQAGEASATITSLQRTAADQARIMFDNCLNQGVASQYQLYASAGDAVVRVYDVMTRGMSRTEILRHRGPIQDAMLAEINRQGPRNVSNHIADPSELGVIDLAPSSFDPNTRRRFIDAVGRDRRVTAFHQPPADPAYHLEIPQPR